MLIYICRRKLELHTAIKPLSPGKMVLEEVLGGWNLALWLGAGGGGGGQVVATGSQSVNARCVKESSLWILPGYVNH